MNKLFSILEKHLVIVYALIVILFSMLTYTSNYNYPNSSVWDEVFHISSAEKYITGTYFMEAHPPLGKLLIAAGESLVNPNTDFQHLNPIAKVCLSNTQATYKGTEKDDKGVETVKEQKTIKDSRTGKDRPMTLLDIREKTGVAVDKSSFNNTDSIGSDTNNDSKPDSQYPEYFSFCGYRLFPALFGALTAPLFFLLILALTRNKHLALLFSSLYIFDNALLIQARAAMLDSIQIFFVMLSLLISVWMIEGLSQKTKPKTLQKAADFDKAMKYDGFVEQTPSQGNEQRSGKDGFAEQTPSQGAERKDGFVEQIPVKANDQNAALQETKPGVYIKFKDEINYSGNQTDEDGYNKQNDLDEKGAKKQIPFWKYALLGLSLGLACAVKHNGVVLVLLPFIVLAYEAIRNTFGFRFGKDALTNKYKFKQNLISLGKIVGKILTFAICIVVAYISVFYIHFGLANTINYKNSNNGGLYKGSSAYQEIIRNKDTWNPDKIPVMMADNWTYMNEYHKGVPKLDYTKSGENGSYPANWLVMNRTISYRWETPDGTRYSYSYLIGNPLIWFIGLIALILTCVLIIGRIFFNLKVKSWRTFGYLGMFLILYVAYMATMLYTIQVRVMYLYHYFIGLILTLTMAPLLVNYWFEKDLEQEFDVDLNNKPFIIYTFLTILILCITWVFAFYSPFTYYGLLTHDQFMQRAIFDFWQMKPAK